MTSNDHITSVLSEEREFPPPEGFSAAVGGAYIDSLEAYEKEHQRSLDDPEGFRNVLPHDG